MQYEFDPLDALMAPDYQLMALPDWAMPDSPASAPDSPAPARPVDNVEQPEDAECPICRDRGPGWHRTACDHIFHTECIESWIRRNRTCPICRGPLIYG